MPIYDYVCRDCAHTVEVIHGIDAPGPQACPNCGGSVRKALSQPAVVFKGSGWAKKERSAATGSDKSDSAADDKAAKPADTPSATGAGPAEGSTPS